MARKEHSKHYYYQHRAVKHERAARATSGQRAEGHREVAKGYFKLARATSGSASRAAAHRKPHKKGKSHHRGRRRDAHGRFK